MWSIVRNVNGWIINEEGQVLIRNGKINFVFSLYILQYLVTIFLDTGDHIWKETSSITFDERNRPLLKITDENGNRFQLLNYLHLDEDSTEENVCNTVSNPHVSDAPAEAAKESISANNRTVWTNESTLALIAAIESRFEDLFHIHKKKFFWDVVNEELCSQGYNVSFYNQMSVENVQVFFSVPSQDLSKKNGKIYKGHTRVVRM